MRGYLNTKQNKHSGFTLIEMLIGIVIMGMAISMVSVSVSQSVRNQERMQNLLDVYEIALTSRDEVIARVEQRELEGSYINGDATISWQAELLERGTEAPVLLPELARYSVPSFQIQFYRITSIIETPYARRVYEFEHMVERHNQETIRGF